MNTFLILKNIKVLDFLFFTKNLNLKTKFEANINLRYFSTHKFNKNSKSDVFDRKLKMIQRDKLVQAQSQSQSQSFDLKNYAYLHNEVLNFISK